MGAWSVVRSGSRQDPCVGPSRPWLPLSPASRCAGREAPLGTEPRCGVVSGATSGHGQDGRDQGPLADALGFLVRQGEVLHRQSVEAGQEEPRDRLSGPAELVTGAFGVAAATGAPSTTDACTCPRSGWGTPSAARRSACTERSPTAEQAAEHAVVAGPGLLGPATFRSVSFREAGQNTTVQPSRPAASAVYDTPCAFVPSARPQSPSSQSTRPIPRSGAPSTGRSPSPTTTGRPLATRLPPWRSDDAPKGTRSGDGRHRPTTTRAIVVGIGPSRPDQEPSGVRDPAPAFPDHAHDACRPDAERTRATRTPNTVRGVRLSMTPGNRTHSRSVSRNG